MSSYDQQSRLQRALNQRLFLLGILEEKVIEQKVIDNENTNNNNNTDEKNNNNNLPTQIAYEVLGNSRSIYKVTLCRIPNCTCPDYLSRKNRCKHILFILHRCLGLPSDSTLLFQSSLDENELQFIVNYKTNTATTRSKTRKNSNNNIGNVDNISNLNILPPKEIQERYQALKRQLSSKNGNNSEDNNTITTIKQRQITEDDDCPICMESLLESGEELVWCKTQCGNSIHKMCFDRWSTTVVDRSGYNSKKSVNCIYCRAVWSLDELVDSGVKKVRKYIKI